MLFPVDMSAVRFCWKFSLASLLFCQPLPSAPVAHTHLGSLVVVPFTLILKFYRYFEPIVSSVSLVSFIIFFLWIFIFLVGCQVFVC